MPIEVANASRNHATIFRCKPSAQFAFNDIKVTDFKSRVTKPLAHELAGNYRYFLNETI